MNAVRQIVRALRTAQAASERDLGVSAAQLFVLREIDKSGAPTIGQLASRTATCQSSVSEVVARLASHDLVVRDRSTTDRRRASITLTRSGRALLARSPETVQERLLSAFQRLTSDRQELIADGLEEWIREAGLSDVATSMFFEP